MVILSLPSGQRLENTLVFSSYFNSADAVNIECPPIGINEGKCHEVQSHYNGAGLTTVGCVWTGCTNDYCSAFFLRLNEYCINVKLIFF